MLVWFLIGKNHIFRGFLLKNSRNLDINSMSVIFVLLHISLLPVLIPDLNSSKLFRTHLVNGEKQSLLITLNENIYDSSKRKRICYRTTTYKYFKAFFKKFGLGDILIAQTF